MSGEFLETPLTLSIAQDKQIKFKSSAEIRAWCEKEASAWRAISGSTFRQHGEMYDAVNSLIQRLHQSASSYESNLGAPGQLSDLQNVLQTLSNQVASGRQILSESPLGQYIIEIAKSEKGVAAAMYFIATKEEHENIPTTKVVGIALGFLANFYAGVSKKTAVSAIRSVEVSSANFSALVDSVKHDFKEKSDELSMQISNIQKKFKSVSDLLAKSVRSKREVFGKQRADFLAENQATVSASIDASTQSINEFREFMEKQISLQVPASYWASKRDRHRNATVVSAFVFLLYVGVLVKYTWSNIVLKYTDIFGFLENWRDAGLGAVGVMAGALALALIFARVLYRTYASQLHLWNDAGERVTMIETYLALAEKGHAKEEFLGALMSRLFLPASDGIVRDDLGSVGPIDLATRLTGGRQ